MKRKRLLKSQHELVCNMFEMGLSIVRIADSLDVPRNAVSKVVKEQYPEHQGRKFINIKQLVSRYNSGVSVSALAEEFDAAIATVQSRLLAEGIELRTKGEERRRHHFNQDFFETIDTEQKAYWLGFLFADGSVSAKRADVSLTLSRKDRGHIQKFLEDIEYHGPGISDGRTTGFGVEVEYSGISLRSEKMKADLIDKGCMPRKSLDCSPPLNLPKELNIHFIRGVNDGDGYVSKAGPASLEIVGSYGLLTWIAQELGVREPQPHKTIWRIRTSGRPAIETMSLLYRDSTVFLDRKKTRAERYYE